jgi:ApaG protein
MTITPLSMTDIRCTTTSAATTHDVRVEVESRYHPDRSAPSKQHWFFSYTIRITNLSDQTVQLISRHWVITDETGHIEEVIGEGVVGEQPTLAPGEAFQYTSFCPLKTAHGSMHGTYQMLTSNGEQFDVDIAPFALREPYTVH